jgi:ATP phosphoribosyltransferase regulatory subunit
MPSQCWRRTAGDRPGRCTRAARRAGRSADGDGPAAGRGAGAVGKGRLGAGRADGCGPGAGAPRAAALPALYGGPEVLQRARRSCLTAPGSPGAGRPGLAGRHLQRAHPELQVGFDLSDLSGYAYYSGPRFALYGADWSDALVRGGRYDEVGAIFGRNRPAVGFSLDLKALAEVARCRLGARPSWRPGARTPNCGRPCGACAKPARWSSSPCRAMPPKAQAVACDRELVSVHGRWAVLAR